MTRPSVSAALPLVREQYHHEALLMLDVYGDYLTARFGADEVERMRCRHREALRDNPAPCTTADPWCSQDPADWPEVVGFTNPEDRP